MTLFSEYETVLELRRYTLRPGRRDELIELFEREFVEPQEAAGMHLFGLFRAEEDFVWLRGFRSLASRAEALEAFYTGPVWKEHRDAANATMLDSDNVLLLRPVRRGLTTPPPGSKLYVTIAPVSAAPGSAGSAPPVSAGSAPPASAGSAPPAFAASAPPVSAPPASAFAAFETEPSPNDFPQLPVRTDGPFSVWFSRSGPGSELEPTTRSLLR